MNIPRMSQVQCDRKYSGQYGGHGESPRQPGYVFDGLLDLKRALVTPRRISLAAFPGHFGVGRTQAVNDAAKREYVGVVVHVATGKFLTFSPLILSWGSRRIFPAMLIFNSPSESFSRGVFFATFLGIFVPQELQRPLFGDKNRLCRHRRIPSQSVFR